MVLLAIIILVSWVGIDAKERKNNYILWAIGTLFLAPVIAPIYFAKRNLKKGEMREGGTGWNILKNFALIWTGLMFFAGISGIIGAGSALLDATSGAEAAGASIGTGLGLLAIAMFWFFPMVGAMVLGFFLKKSSKVEEGPTGELAETQKYKFSDEELFG